MELNGAYSTIYIVKLNLKYQYLLLIIIHSGVGNLNDQSVSTCMAGYPNGK